MLKKMLSISLITLLATNIAFAQTSPTINIEAINNMPTAGNPVLLGVKYFDLNYGPILEKNTQKPWSFTPRSQLYDVSWGLSIPQNPNCFDNNGNPIKLNPENYTGDTIIITYINKNRNGSVHCTCTGSACII